MNSGTPWIKKKTLMGKLVKSKYSFHAGQCSCTGVNFFLAICTMVMQDGTTAKHLKEGTWDLCTISATSCESIVISEQKV